MSNSARRVGLERRRELCYVSGAWAQRLGVLVHLRATNFGPNLVQGAVPRPGPKRSKKPGAPGARPGAAPPQFCDPIQPQPHKL